jgi:hypothetical protein
VKFHVSRFTTEAVETSNGLRPRDTLQLSKPRRCSRFPPPSNILKG